VYRRFSSVFSGGYSGRSGWLIERSIRDLMPPCTEGVAKRG
jgi:hypothetical protein